MITENPLFDILQEDKVNRYVLYHNDTDGLASAAVAYKTFGDLDTTYIPVQYGQPFPEKVVIDRDTVIYILDFSYKKEILEQINKDVRHLVVLDHHITAEQDLQNTSFEAIFDKTKCGATLTWEYFYPNLPIPSILTLVEDRDLWKHQYENSSYLENYIRVNKPISVATFASWLNEWFSVASLIEEGKALFLHQTSFVNTVFNNKEYKLRKFIIPDGTILKVATYTSSIYVSEIGNMLVNKLDIDCSVNIRMFDNGLLVVNLRAADKTDINVANIAKQFGGGGHAKAAGFSIKLEDVPKFMRSNILAE